MVNTTVKHADSIVKMLILRTVLLKHASIAGYMMEINRLFFSRFQAFNFINVYTLQLFMYIGCSMSLMTVRISKLKYPVKLSVKETQQN